MGKKYTNKDLMKLAIEVQSKCSDFPKVGAVIAKNGELLSTGYRGEMNGVHAERMAIEKLDKEQLSDATLFTTLEPCVRLEQFQPKQSCSDLIVDSGVSEVFIGVLDPNGTIYSQGYEKLLKNSIAVFFFNNNLRSEIEEETFEYGELSVIYAHGKRRVPVVHGGTSIDVTYSKTDTRTIKIRWETLQYSHGIVDLHSEKGSVRSASGAANFSDITNPDVFRFPSLVSRMKVNAISIVKPIGSSFYVLIKLLAIYENDILFQWQVRNG